jgi:hypothetical protein
MMQAMLSITSSRTIVSQGMVQMNLTLLCLYYANIVKQDWLNLNHAQSIDVIVQFFARKEVSRCHKSQNIMNWPDTMNLWGNPTMPTSRMV